MDAAQRQAISLCCRCIFTSGFPVFPSAKMSCISAEGNIASSGADLLAPNKTAKKKTMHPQHVDFKSFGRLFPTFPRSAGTTYGPGRVMWMDFGGHQANSHQKWQNEKHISCGRFWSLPDTGGRPGDNPGGNHPFFFGMGGDNCIPSPDFPLGTRSVKKIWGPTSPSHNPPHYHLPAGMG